MDTLVGIPLICGDFGVRISEIDSPTKFCYAIQQSGNLLFSLWVTLRAFGFSTHNPQKSQETDFDWAIPKAFFYLHEFSYNLAQLVFSTAPPY